MPMKRGRNFLYLGETLDARDAEEAGLVNSVVPDDRLIEEALRLADRLCQIPTVALRQMKRAISRSYELMGMRESLEYNLETLASVLNNQPIEDLVARQRLIERDGLKSFLQSRDGSFQ